MGIMCNTQSQELGMETVMDDETIPLDVQGRSDAITIGRKKRKGQKRSICDEVRWGTAEGFSWILRGWVDQLKNMGIDVEIAVLQLWVLYLRKLKMGFEKKGEIWLLGKENLKHRDMWNMIGGPPGVLDRLTLTACKRRRIAVEEEEGEEDEFGEETLEERRRRNRKRKSFYKTVSASEGGTSERASSVGGDGFTSSGAESESEYSVGGYLTDPTSLSMVMERCFLRKALTKTSNSKISKHLCLPSALHIKQVAAVLTLAVIGRPKSAIIMADMVRLFSSECLSWRSANNFLPKSYNLVHGEASQFSGVDVDITPNMLSELVFRLASFLHDKPLKHLHLVPSYQPFSQGRSLNIFKSILSRYLREFSLPSVLCKDITQCFKKLYLTTMIASLQPYMPMDHEKHWAKNKFPMVSKRILALILLALKFHCGLDDQYEVYMSHNIKKMAMMDNGCDIKYFDILSWLRLSKLRLDHLMRHNCHMRIQYQRLAHVGTPHLALSALLEKLRLDDQDTVGGGPDKKPEKRFSDLAKLMTELTVSVKPADFSPCLEPILEQTKVLLKSGSTKSVLKNHLEQLLSFEDANMRLFYEMESCTLKNILHSNHGVAIYSEFRKNSEKKVKLSKNWVATQIASKNSKNNCRVKTDRLFRRQHKMQFAEMITSGTNMKSKFHVPYPKRSPDFFFRVTNKVYWFTHHYTQHELSQVQHDKELLNQQVLNIIPSNFAWILKYFACYAYMSPLELLEELTEIEMLILALDPHFFGLPKKLKPNRKLVS